MNKYAKFLRPMSTAPKDGSRIHVLEIHDGKLYVCGTRWINGAWLNDGNIPITPARWIEMPVPVQRFVGIAKYAETILDELIAEVNHAQS